MSRFIVEMLPASDGDCLLVSWGDEERLSHMVVDGGRSGAYPHLKKRLAQIAEAKEELVLYVVTHFDADHIAGTLAYLRDRTRPIVPKVVWYNSYRQMVAEPRRSIKQGDECAELLDRLQWPINREFTNRTVSLENAPDVIDVAGLRITLLSPDEARLKALGERWREYRFELGAEEQSPREGMRGGRERPPVPTPIIIEDLIADGETDHELPNGTSIAFVAEWEGRRVLFGGDAHPDLLAKSLKALGTVEAPYRIDLYKVSHHGSAKNTSREVVQAMTCARMAVSTNGSLHGHPDPQSIARFVRFGPVGAKTIYFNYATPRTEPWSDAATMAKYGYVALFPPGDPGRLTIDVMADD